MSTRASRSPAQFTITLIMDALVVVAVICVVHLVIAFFGQLAALAWGSGVLKLTVMVVIPLGVQAIKTPYAGVLDFNSAITCLILLAIEWALGLIRRSV